MLKLQPKFKLSFTRVFKVMHIHTYPVHYSLFHSYTAAYILVFQTPNQEIFPEAKNSLESDRET